MCQSLGGTNAEIVDLLVFHEPGVHALPVAECPNNTLFINLGEDGVASWLAHGLSTDPDQEGSLAVSLAALLRSHPYGVAEFKPAWGAAFSAFLKPYSHWTATDPDMLFGDLSRWINEDERWLFDAVTYAYDGDANRIFSRGQWAVFKNTEALRYAFRECPSLGASLWSNLRSRKRVRLSPAMEATVQDKVRRRRATPLVQRGGGGAEGAEALEALPEVVDLATVEARGVVEEVHAHTARQQAAAGLQGSESARRQAFISSEGCPSAFLWGRVKFKVAPKMFSDQSLRPVWLSASSGTLLRHIANPDAAVIYRHAVEPPLDSRGAVGNGVRHWIQVGLGRGQSGCPNRMRWIGALARCVPLGEWVELAAFRSLIEQSIAQGWANSHELHGPATVAVAAAALWDAPAGPDGHASGLRGRNDVETLKEVEAMALRLQTLYLEAVTVEGAGWWPDMVVASLPPATAPFNSTDLETYVGWAPAGELRLWDYRAAWRHGWGAQSGFREGPQGGDADLPDPATRPFPLRTQASAPVGQLPTDDLVLGPGGRAVEQPPWSALEPRRGPPLAGGDGSREAAMFHFRALIAAAPEAFPRELALPPGTLRRRPHLLQLHPALGVRYWEVPAEGAPRSGGCCTLHGAPHALPLQLGPKHLVVVVDWGDGVVPALLAALEPAGSPSEGQGELFVAARMNAAEQVRDTGKTWELGDAAITMCEPASLTPHRVPVESMRQLGCSAAQQEQLRLERVRQTRAALGDGAPATEAGERQWRGPTRLDGSTVVMPVGYAESGLYSSGAACVAALGAATTSRLVPLLADDLESSRSLTLVVPPAPPARTLLAWCLVRRAVSSSRSGLAARVRRAILDAVAVDLAGEPTGRSRPSFASADLGRFQSDCIRLVAARLEWTRDLIAEASRVAAARLHSVEVARQAVSSMVEGGLPSAAGRAVHHRVFEAELLASAVGQPVQESWRGLPLVDRGLAMVSRALERLLPEELLADARGALNQLDELGK